ncbi:MAG: ribonuclease PH [Planctomycetes bacterium]|nr:ribonuclease PH [Planctomycetota bacterium]
MSRSDGRANDQLREIKLSPGFIDSADGSVFIEWGKTRVVCTASIEEKVPPFLMNTGMGWVSAEYGMLPASTDKRKQRDGRRGGQVDGRTVEIQRIIGRVLRGVVKQKALGPRTIWIDCDVIQADGGTRTASVTGAWVALYLAIKKLRDRGQLKKDPLISGVAGVSVGIVDGEPRLDLSYEEDSRAEADFNFFMTHEGDVIEVQGSAEKHPVKRDLFLACHDLAEVGIKRLMSIQNQVLIGTL